jgi:hypothetical protein
LADILVNIPGGGSLPLFVETKSFDHHQLIGRAFCARRQLPEGDTVEGKAWICVPTRPTDSAFHEDLEHFNIRVVVISEVSELLFKYSGHFVTKDEDDDKRLEYVEE